MTPLLALLLAAAPPAPTGDWIPFDVPAQSGSAYYDSGSVERAGDLVRVWVRWNPEDEASRLHEGRVLTELDCRLRVGRLLRVEAYDREGSLIASDESTQPMQPIRTGYASHGIELALCPRA